MNIEHNIHANKIEEGMQLTLDNGMQLKIIESLGENITGLSFHAKITSDFRLSEEKILFGEDVFVKLPRPPEKYSPIEMKNLKSIRERFVLEHQKGDLMNHVAMRCIEGNASHQEQQLGEIHNIQFKVPFYQGYSSVTQIQNSPPIDQPSDSKDLDGYSGLPILLYTFINRSNGVNVSESLPKVESSKEWLSFARAIVRVVQRIHNQGILHSSICPRHILKSSEYEFHLVGFGYAALCVHPLGYDAVMEEDHPYRAPELGQVGSLDALWFPADLFSVGAILFKLVTGIAPDLYKEIEEKGNPSTRYQYKLEYTDVTNLKEYVYQEINSRNKGVLEDNENIVKIIDKCLRHDPNERFSCAEEMLQAIGIAEKADAHFDRSENSEEALLDGTSTNRSDEESMDLKRCIDNILRHPDIQTGQYRFFGSFLQESLENAKNISEHIDNKHVEIFGDRDSIVSSLCQITGSLRQPAVYRTITLPSYWTDENLGSNGRFLTMNKHLARQGVKVQRVFLVPGPFHTLAEEEQEILRHQLAASNDIKQMSGKENSLNGELSIKVKIVLDESEILNFERAGNSVAFISSNEAIPKFDQLRKSDSQEASYLLLNFVSQGELVMRYGKWVIQRQIKKVRFWDPAGIPAYVARFERSYIAFNDSYQNAVPISRYIEGYKNWHLKDILDFNEMPVKIE